MDRGRRHALASSSGSFLLGALGVLIFSFSLPATRLAVEELDPVVVGVGRAVVAAAFAAVLLVLLPQPRPRRDQLPGLVLVGLGVVVGFPLLTALALERLTASHGAVVIALLPAATAAWAGERPGWALVLAFPITFAVSLPFALTGDLAGDTGAWLGFAYVCLFSMFLGFFAWYGGLARGGVAKIGQIQHAQPILTLAWSALVLGETITTGTAVAATVVLLFVVATQRARVGSRPAPLVASRR